MNETDARTIMGLNSVGSNDLNALQSPFSFSIGETPAVPFSKKTLEAHASSHLLVLAPLDPEITINALREKFGVDPSQEPCMYDQDWYLNEGFASKTTLDGKWHLLPKQVRDDLRGQAPEAIEQGLRGEQFPSAILCTFTFFVWWFLRKEALWKNDFLWCSDVDHNGDRIYVGRYEDPAGMNKKGFNIHRHLSIRSTYSAAPEILR